MPGLNKRMKKLHPELQQVPVRLLRSDYAAIKKLMIDNGHRFQLIIEAFLDAYTKLNPLALKIVEDYCVHNDIPKTGITRPDFPRWKTELIPDPEPPTSAHPSDSPHKREEARELFDEIAKGSGID